jgi:dTDP-4-dehydrorhamnose reductase
MRVLVTGAGGQLGQAIVQRFTSALHARIRQSPDPMSRHDVTALTRADLDITRHDDVLRAVARVRPEVIINCAAYNAVDRAEDDALAALEGNALALRSLARAAENGGAVLVHYGTDFVFDGEASEPYDETSQTAPKSVYGQSKLLGEWLAADAPRHYVLRVESLFGGPLPRSSIDRIVEALRDHRSARAFTDRTVSPSYVDDVAVATEELLARGAPSGVYHCVNDGFASWYDVGVEIARLLGTGPRLEPVRMDDVQLRAPRPRFCALSNAKLRATGINMPTWQDALARYVGRLAGTAR